MQGRNWTEVRARRAVTDLWNKGRDQLKGLVVTALIAAAAAVVYVVVDPSDWKPRLLDAGITSVVAPTLLALGAFCYFWITAPAKIHSEAYSSAPPIPFEPWHAKFFATLCVWFVIVAWAAALWWAGKQTSLRQEAQHHVSELGANLRSLEVRRQHLQGESDYRKQMLWGSHGYFRQTQSLQKRMKGLQQQLADAKNKPPRIIYAPRKGAAPTAPQPPQESPTVPAVDPDTVYQNGQAVGTVSGAEEHLNRSEIYFAEISGAGNLDESQPFRYRKWLLRIEGVPKVSAGLYIGPDNQSQPNVRLKITCRIVAEAK